MTPENSFLLRVHAVPNAKRTVVVGMLGEALKIKIQAVPEGGRANKELENFLAGTLKLSKRAVSVESGTTAREKLIRITGTTKEESLKILLATVK